MTVNIATSMLLGTNTVITRVTTNNIPHISVNTLSLHQNKLAGIVDALKTLKGDLVIYVRSKSIIADFKSNLKSWMVNGFRKSMSQTVMNMWRTIGHYSIIAGRKVSLRYGSNKVEQKLASNQAYSINNKETTMGTKIAETIIVNKHLHAFDIYIGRSKTNAMHFGNPFSHKDIPGTIKCESSADAVAYFKDWILGEADHDIEPARRQWILDNVHTLLGKRCACWCKKEPGDKTPCHGDVLKALAEGSLTVKTDTLATMPARKVIDSFKGEYAWLSNMYPCSIIHEGFTFSCVESAYQCAKTNTFQQKVVFPDLNGYEAKKEGKTVTLRSDWMAVRVDIMGRLVQQKFQNKELARLLLETGDAYIEEGNNWGDTFWGVCNGKGENVLGKILMEVRDGLTKGNDMKKQFVMACDGSGMTANVDPQCPGGWAMVCQGEGLKMSAWGGEVNTTNNVMELKSVIYGICGFLKGLTEIGVEAGEAELTIVLDSEYVYHGFAGECRYAKWEKANWKNSQKKPVLNLKVWQGLAKSVKQAEDAGVTINWVRQDGHQGDGSLYTSLNNKSDKMAGMVKGQVVDHGYMAQKPAMRVNGGNAVLMFPPKED